MGVRAELLGRKVRCPHCSQVALAPAHVAQSEKPFSHSAPTPPSAPASVPPVEPEASLHPLSSGDDGSNITFDKKKEAADSILSEENDTDDEVFSSQTGSKVTAPVVPAFDPDPAAVPPHGGSASKIPTLELRTPVDIIPAPISASSLLPPQPPPPPLVSGPASTSPAASMTPNNPFAFDTSKPVPVEAPTSPSAQVALEAPVPAQGEPGTRTRDPLAIDRPHASRWVFYGLVAYAAVMTVLALYGLFFRSQNKPDPGHPLSTIPDTFGEFDPASRKKVSRLKLDFDAPLPAGQLAGLGQRLQIGQLEIEPIAAEKRRLRIIREGQGETQRRTTNFDALVLQLRVKNLSPDRPIFPLDPAFTRAAKMDDRPAMRLAIGRLMLYGGAISWPFPERVRREYEEAQARDDQPLNPAETRDYVVFTNEDSSLAQVIQKASEPLLWRVQIRRGVVDHGGKEVPVSAIVGIEFKPSEIRNLD
jgi:hypothetical protein